jgi:hypothetical protein
VRRKGILVATAAVLAVMAASALAAVIGTAGSVTYATVTSPLMANEEVEVQTNCIADKNITGVVFGSDFLGISPKELAINSAATATIEARASSNDTLTSYVMCTSNKIRYASKTESHIALIEGQGKVTCPGSRHVVGGGVDAGSRFIKTTNPFDSRDKGKQPDDGWKASTVGNNTASVEIMVACSRTAPRYSKESLILPPGSSSAVIPKCKGGTHLSGAGAQFSSSSIYARLNSMRPRDGGDADSVPDDEVLINMGNDGSNPDDAKLTGYAICID